jgi:hypothetical protein
MLVKLTPQEKKLIRKIASLQLESLKIILTNEVDEEDVPIFCLENEIPEDELNEAVLRSIENFESVRQKPTLLFELEGDDLSLSLHILNSFFKKARYKEVRKSLGRKLRIKEMFLWNLN